MKKTVLTFLAVALALAEALLVLVSWLLSATMTEGVRSLLSAEGIRWFAAHFARLQLTPLLSWLLLAAMAWGCVRSSRLVHGMLRPTGYRQRLALRVAAISILSYCGVVALLVAVPHAVLLSATGRLWPSPFSAALIPLLCFGTILASVAYGLVCRSFRSVADICQSFVDGLASSAPLLFVYVLLVQFYVSLRYVFLF